MKRFAVVGCRECSHFWIVEHFGQQETVQCPQCSHTRQADLVRVQQESDDWAVACELRARLLAQRAGEFDSFTAEVDDYGVLEDNLDFSAPTTEADEPPLFTDVLEEEAEAHLQEKTEERRNILKEEAEEYLEQRFGTISLEAGSDEDEEEDLLNHFETEAGSISVSNQSGVQAAAHVQADCSPADLWERIATTDGVQEALVDAVRQLLAAASNPSRPGVLFEAGVTAANGGFARLLADLDRAPDAMDSFGTNVHERAFDLISGIGQDGMTPLGHLDLDAIVKGPLAALDAAEVTPTVAVFLGKEFRERRREQREDTLWMLAALGKVVDLHVVASGLTMRWLLDEHRTDLPVAFSKALSAQCRDRDDPEEKVEAARDRLKPEGRGTRILRDLAAEPNDTLLYSELKEMYQVTNGRVSQLLTTLEDLGLVERYGPRDQKQVDLLPAGLAYLDLLDGDDARQEQLDAAFSAAFQSSTDRRVTTRTGAPPAPPTDGGNRPRYRCPTYHHLSWLQRPVHAATAAAAPDGGVSLVDHPSDPLDDRAAPLASFNEERGELLVGAEYDNPMAWMTSTALALVNPRTFGRLDLEDRLEDESFEFQQMFEGAKEILRDQRCLGWLSDEEVQDPSDFAAALLEGREKLLELTQRHRHGEYADRDSFRGDITSLAHGLAGTAVHMYDLLDIDVIRFARIPRFKRFDEQDRADLAWVLTKHITITSRYNHLTAERGLFEQREKKRRSMMDTKVDASDPLGELIGGLAVFGPDVDTFEDELAQQLSNPGEVAEDAPEFAVRSMVKTPDRTTYAETAQRICRQKNLSPTRDAVTLLRALTGSPLDVARGLFWALQEEDTHRDLRLDEVRVALGALDTDRLLPDTKPTVSKMLDALLQTDQTLSGQELADAADVSRTSVWRHLPKLEELGLVQEDGDGYRLMLPFATSEERGRSILPEALEDDRTEAPELLLDLVIDAIGVSNAGRLGDPDDPLGEAFYFPPDYSGLREELPWIDPWIRVAERLSSGAEPEPTTVQFGATLQQTALPSGDIAVDDAVPAD